MFIQAFSDMQEDLKKAKEVLQKGGIILYPTDTIWGIGCDATFPKAVERIYKLKQRSDTKSMLVLVDEPWRIDRYVAEVPDIARQLVEVADQPLTIIYPAARNLAPNLVGEDLSIGIRVTSDPFCKELIKALGRPLVSTSANLSGQPSPENFDAISEALKKGVDYTVQWRQDDMSHAKPSSIIRVGMRGEIEILRK